MLQYEAGGRASALRRWSQRLILPFAVLAVVGGPRLYMNLRPPDPLPRGFENYTRQSFEAAFATGEPILVDVYASWCPTCLRQQRVLDQLGEDKRLAHVRAFRVDFDHEPDFLRAHGVHTQSTLIMFVGEREVSRTVGVTDGASIRNQVVSALSRDR